MKKQIISILLLLPSIAQAGQVFKSATTTAKPSRTTPRTWVQKMTVSQAPEQHPAEQIHNSITRTQKLSYPARQIMVPHISPEQLETMKEGWLTFSFLNLFSRLSTLVENYLNKNPEMHVALKKFKDEVHTSIMRVKEPISNAIKEIDKEEFLIRQDITNSGYGIMLGLWQLTNTLQMESTEAEQQKHIKMIMSNILAHLSHLSTEAHRHFTTSAEKPGMKKESSSATVVKSTPAVTKKTPTTAKK